MSLQLVDGVGGQGGKETSGEALGDTFRYACCVPVQCGYLQSFAKSAHAASKLL
jgi:hypothetical protein